MHLMVTVLKSGLLADSCAINRQRSWTNYDNGRRISCNWKSCVTTRIKFGPRMAEKKEKKKEKIGWHMSGKFDKYMGNQGPWFNSYTPLNTDKEKIMDEDLNANLIPTL